MTESPVAGVHADEITRLQEVARQIRLEVIKAVYHARAGHLGGPSPPPTCWPPSTSTSCASGPTSRPGRTATGSSSARAIRRSACMPRWRCAGYFPVEELATFDAAHSRLQGHPDMTRLPGLDMSTGSLGMGISAGMGMALGARLTGHDVRAYVMLGDGECQEGEVWEAAMAAPRYALDNLIVIVDHNKLQQYGWPGDGPDGRIPPQVPGELVAKWTAFGWRVLEVDGHDMADILRVLEEAARGDGRPTAVIAHTIKGKGVSFMEGHYFWHTRAIKPEEFATAMADLGEPLPATDGDAR